MGLRRLLGLKQKLAAKRRLVGPRAWRNARTHKAPDSWPVSEFLNEDHHHLYGRPWAVGRGYFDFLCANGLKPSDSVLDFGCGAGRLGIWLIAYLAEGNYIGVDNHPYSVQAFQRYEIPLHALEDRKPLVILDDSSEPHRLGKAFDLILDLWVTGHFGKQDTARTYRSFQRALRPNGRIITNKVPSLSEEELAQIGIRILHRERRGNWKGEDFWHIMVRR